MIYSNLDMITTTILIKGKDDINIPNKAILTEKVAFITNLSVIGDFRLGRSVLSG